MKPGSLGTSLGPACQSYGVKSVAQLKCIYTSACSVGNKQEELEPILQQESCDIVAITER